MSTSVSYNNLNINDLVSYITQDTTHDNAPSRVLNSYKVARRDGDKLVNAYYGSKEIILNGYVIGTSQADFESKVDTLKKNLSRIQGTLLITCNGVNRQYNSTTSEVQVKRASDNIDWAPVSIRFLVPDGKGYDTAVTNVTYAVDTVLSFIGWFVNGGSAEAFPVFTLTINAQVNLTKIEFAGGSSSYGTDGWLTILGTDTPFGSFQDGDVVVIDFANFTVSVNGTLINFSGSFMRFVKWTSGDIFFNVIATATSRNITVESSFTKAYL